MAQMYSHSFDHGTLIDAQGFGTDITTAAAFTAGFNNILLFVDLTWDTATELTIRAEGSTDNSDWYHAMITTCTCPDLGILTGTAASSPLIITEGQYTFAPTASLKFYFYVPVGAAWTRFVVGGSGVGNDTVSLFARSMNNGPITSYGQ